MVDRSFAMVASVDDVQIDRIDRSTKSELEIYLRYPRTDPYVGRCIIIITTI